MRKLLIIEKSEFACENEDEDLQVSLTDKEKYKIFMPMLNTIASLVSCHSTNTFLQYVEEFKRIECFIRKGKSVLPTSDIQHSTSTSTSTSTSLPMSAEQSTISASTSDANQELLSPAPVPSEQTTNISSEDVAMAHNLAENSNAEPASKFKLKFKRPWQRREDPGTARNN